MKPKNVAIVGFTPHRNLTPFENDEWEIWGLNDLYIDMPAVPNSRLRWFQLHPWAEGRPVQSAIDLTAGPHHPRDPSHVQWLETAASQCRVYLMEERKEVPSGIVYPYEDVYKYFGKKYFTNSITYMIGLAIMEGFEKIAVYGVDMMVAGGAGSEYGYQRPSCEWLLGWAMAKLGPENVIIPVESDLLATAYTYADEYGSDYRMKMRYEQEEVNKRLAQIRNTKRSSELAEAEMVGAANTMERFLRGWMPGDDMKPNPGTAPDENTHKVKL